LVGSGIIYSSIGGFSGICRILTWGEFKSLFEKSSIVAGKGFPAYGKQVLRLKVTEKSEFKFANCLGDVLQ
jgi:hypothetical protein